MDHIANSRGVRWCIAFHFFNQITLKQRIVLWMNKKLYIFLFKFENLKICMPYWTELMHIYFSQVTVCQKEYVINPYIDENVLISCGRSMKIAWFFQCPYFNNSQDFWERWILPCAWYWWPLSAEHRSNASLFIILYWPTSEGLLVSPLKFLIFSIHPQRLLILQSITLCPLKPFSVIWWH